MLQKSQAQTDFDRELEKIDAAIIACKKDFEDLLLKRHEVIARKFGIGIMDLLESIAKEEDVPQEAMDIIISMAMKKRNNLK